ncbi:Uncharacterized protein HZ326_18766 [Fusarium oxysporum f. sp. albedinis]|nr:Uncharacterized protein HZ326_18766 [Fusarium oxysporum f. sp. albedinis]
MAGCFVIGRNPNALAYATHQPGSKLEVDTRRTQVVCTMKPRLSRLYQRSSTAQITINRAHSSLLRADNFGPAFF